MTQTSTFEPTWQGSLRELAYVIFHIRSSRAFGRLSLRSPERLSVVHLYFRAGKLVNVVGNRGDERTILYDMKDWTYANLRFDRGIAPQSIGVHESLELIIDEVLLQLRDRGVVFFPKHSNVVEGHLNSTPEVKQLITPWEWRVLIEGTRRISFAVSHLVGPKEAFSVLRDILEDCSSAFPAFASLRIAPTGYLEVTNSSLLNDLSREDLLEGFSALFATCQYFCAPLIGEQNAHRLLVQALRDVGPALVSLGVFHLDNRLLSQ